MRGPVEHACARQDPKARVKRHDLSVIADWAAYLAAHFHDILETAG